jgi:hypothetical protein
MNVLVSVLVIVVNVFGRIKIKSKNDITTYDNLRFVSKRKAETKR